MKDNCVKIEGVRGAVRDVNGSEQNIQKKKNQKRKIFFREEKEEVIHSVKISKMVTETSYFLKSFPIFLRQ